MDKFSWKTIDGNKILKELDLSSFSYKGSVVPQDFYSFFNIGDEGSRLCNSNSLLSSTISKDINPYCLNFCIVAISFPR